MSKASKSAVILNGSPRVKSGNTAVLVNWCHEKLTNSSWDVVQHNLYKMDYRGCAHCDMCKKIIDKPGCILNDDFNLVLSQLAKAELIVLASPVYCWAVSGCMSAALDRFYALFKSNKSLIKDKKIVGLFTAAGDAYEGMDLCVESLKRLCGFGDAEYLGVVGATGCIDHKELAKRKTLHAQLDNLLGF